MSHRFVFIPNWPWKANCENNLKDIPVEGRYVAIARWKIRQKVLKTWQKGVLIVLEFLKKVLEI